MFLTTPSLTGAGHVQAAAIMDRAARTVLQLLMRGTSLRSDALSSALDDINLPSTAKSSCELHVARYRGSIQGKGTTKSTLACT